MDDYIVVTTAAPDRRCADDLCTLLVENGCAACAQAVGPIASTYTWKGKVEHAEEWLVVAKSTASSFHRIEALIKAHHPYEVPEIVAMPVSGGSAEYLAWIDETVGMAKE